MSFIRDILPDPLGILGPPTGLFESSRHAKKKVAQQQQALIDSLDKPEPALPVMPVPDDESVKRARKRSLAAQRRRGGRASTMLTSDPILSEETLG